MDWEEALNRLPKPNLYQKRVMVTLWWSATGLIHYSFLNPGEIITSEKSAQQIDAIHSKLQCLQLTLVNRKGPILLHNTLLHTAQPASQKWNKLGYEVLPHLPHSLDLLTTTTDYQVPLLLQASWQLVEGKHFHNQQDVENCFPIVCWIPIHRCLSYRSKQPYFSLTKMCLV